MSSTLKVVAVSGSVQRPTRTLVLLKALIAGLAQKLPIELHLIELSEVGPQFAGVLRREDLPAAVEADLQAIETANLLIAASPVYRASYTGLFKHLFDFVEQYALVGQPVLLAATGGGERHALIIEHQLRPLFSFFQALTLPLGVYASSADFDGHTLRTGAVTTRIAQAVDRALPLVRPLSGGLSSYVSTW